MNTTTDKLNYLAETKTAIKDAIVAKGVAVSESDTFRSYVGKIGEIQSGGKVKLYSMKVHKDATEADVDAILSAIDIKELRDTSQSFISVTGIKELADLDIINSVSLSSTFQQSSIAIIGELNSPLAKDFNYTFMLCRQLKIIKSVDFSSIAKMTATFGNCQRLVFIGIKNLGKSSLANYDFKDVTKWGDDAEEVGARQSLIDSLITYSYDRAANGMPTATITLHADVKARLTEEEKAQITAKGFTIA